MVVIEEAAEEQAAPSAPPASGASPQQFEAIVIIGAGADDANGLYVSTGRTWHGALVLENDKMCLLSREPHRTKTGETRHGWILGQDGNPLYAVESEFLVPPASGWRKFKGMPPPPELQAFDSVTSAGCAAAQALKDIGNELFAARRYDDAEEKWTRALGYKDHISDVTVKVALYSNRAEARLRLQHWEAAQQDADAALALRPAHDKAMLCGAVAAKELKRYSKANELVQSCLDHFPKHPEAKKMLHEIEQLLEEERKARPDKARAARTKLEESSSEKRSARREVQSCLEGALEHVQALADYVAENNSLPTKMRGAPLHYFLMRQRVNYLAGGISKPVLDELMKIPLVTARIETWSKAAGERARSHCRSRSRDSWKREADLWKAKCDGGKLREESLKRELADAKEAAAAALKRAKELPEPIPTLRGDFEKNHSIVRHLSTPGHGCNAKVLSIRSLHRGHLVGEQSPVFALKLITIQKYADLQRAKEEYAAHVAAWRAVAGGEGGVITPVAFHAFFDNPSPYGTLPSEVGFLTEIATGDLSRYGGIINIKSLAYITRTIALVLSTLHKASICWMDCKPQNVLLMPTGRIVLTDFGTTEMGLRGARRGSGFGTPGFKAPEQQQAGNSLPGTPCKMHGPKSDAYGLGMLVRFLFSGVWPKDAPAEHFKLGPDELQEVANGLTIVSPFMRTDVADILSMEFVANAPRDPPLQLQEFAVAISDSTSSTASGSAPPSSSSLSGGTPRPRWADIYGTTSD